jgi:hypothetical protein
MISNTEKLDYNVEGLAVRWGLIAQNFNNSTND